MAGPLVALAVNLVFPRSRVLKGAALVFLVAAATLHGLLAHNQITRSLRAVAKRLTMEQPFVPPAAEADQLRAVDTAVMQYGFDVWLGFSLAVLFAALPCDVLRRRADRNNEI